MNKDSPTSEQDRVPILIGSHRGYNIVKMNSTFYGVPQNLGPMDLQTVEINTIHEIVSGSSLEIARVNINKALEEKNYKNLIWKVTEKSYVKFGSPELIEIEFTHNCNLRCVMCHVSHGDFSDRILDPIFLEHLNGVESKWVLLGSGFEPLMHPQACEILSELSNRGMKIDLITNGTLLTKSVSDRIADLNFANITISFDGIHKETYEGIRRNASYERTIERILYFKNKVKSKQAYFTINYTIMKRNIDEIVESVEFWEKHGFDHIGFIMMVLRDFNESLVQESFLESGKDDLYNSLFDVAKLVIEENLKITLSSPAFNCIPKLKETYSANVIDSCIKSYNPKSQLPFNPRTFFQIGEYPGMHVRCKSPFTCVHILFDGDVFLCKNFKIGNIYENELLDIWYGKVAQKYRKAVLEDPRLCYGCDYYRYCIKGGEIDYNDEKNYYSNNIVYKGRVPRFIEDFDSYNIVDWGGRYYGVPKSLGPTNLTITKVSNIKDVFIDDNIDRLKNKICEYLESKKRLCYKSKIKALITNANNIKDVFIDNNIDRLKNRISEYLKFKKRLKRYVI